MCFFNFKIFFRFFFIFNIFFVVLVSPAVGISGCCRSLGTRRPRIFVVIFDSCFCCSTAGSRLSVREVRSCSYWTSPLAVCHRTTTAHCDCSYPIHCRPCLRTLPWMSLLPNDLLIVVSPRPNFLLKSKISKMIIIIMCLGYIYIYKDYEQSKYSV